MERLHANGGPSAGAPIRVPVHAADFYAARPGARFQHPAHGWLVVRDLLIDVDMGHRWKFRDGRWADAPLCRFIVACAPSATPSLTAGHA